MKEVLCVICKTKIDHSSNGRPRKYCCAACQRAGEKEIGRIDRRMEKLEAARDELSLVPDECNDLYKDLYGRDNQGQLTAINAQLDLCRKRMHVLLGGHSYD